MQYFYQSEDEQEMNKEPYQQSYNDDNSQNSLQFQFNFSSHGQVTPFLSSYFSSLENIENFDLMIQGSMPKKQKRIEKNKKQNMKISKQKQAEPNQIISSQLMLFQQLDSQNKAKSIHENLKIKQSLLEKNNYKRPKREEDKKSRKAQRPKQWKHKNSQLIILRRNQQQSQYQMAYSFAYYIYYAMKCTNVNLSFQQNDFLWEEDNNMRNQQINMMIIEK